MSASRTRVQGIAGHRGHMAWLWVVLCLWVLAFGSVSVEAEAQPRPADVQGAELKGALVRHQELSERLSQLRERRAGLESRYTKLTSSIAEQKRQGASGQLIGGMKLEGALQQARELADQLNGLQEQIREVEGALEYGRQEILAAYQSQLLGLEQKLLTSGDSESRKATIASINALKKERHIYTLRQGATPDLDLRALPSLDAAPNDPEELQALAAELDDTERKLRTHITELDDQITRLERERRLRQKAADFADEESFFDESVRDRRIARANSRVVTPVGDSAGGRGGATVSPRSGAEAGGTGNGEAAAPSDQGNMAGSADEFDSDGAGAVGDDMNDAAPEADPTVGAGGDRATSGNGGVSVGVSEPGVGTPSNLPGVQLPTDPFATPGVVVKTDVEPNSLAGGGGVEGGETLEGQVRSLKDRKKQLEEKAAELRQRSRELKQRANDL